MRTTLQYSVLHKRIAIETANLGLLIREGSSRDEVNSSSRERGRKDCMFNSESEEMI